MDSCDLAAFITAIVCGLSKCLSTQELELLAVVFTQLGDTLGTITVNEGIIESNRSPKK